MQGCLLNVFLEFTMALATGSTPYWVFWVLLDLP